MSLFVIMFNNLLSFQRHKIAFNTDESYLIKCILCIFN